MKNTTKGSAALWVIVIILVLSAGAFLYFKTTGSQGNASQSSNLQSTPDFGSTDVQDTATMPATGTTPPAQTVNSSTVSCSKVFPMDVVQKYIPSYSFALSGGMIEGQVLSCSASS